MKRPAVVFAVLFVAGIVLGDSPASWVWGTAAVYYIAVGIGFYRLLRGKRRSSAADRLLFFAPLFLLFGFMCIGQEKKAYEQKQENFAECMKAGRELLIQGTLKHIRVTETGVRLELRDATVCPYATEEEKYRKVGTLLVYEDSLQAENGTLKIGQKLFVFGKGSEFSEATNPGAFDAKQYYFSLGITGAVQGDVIRITDFSYHRLSQALFQAKQMLMESYVNYLGTEGAGVISSMLLGERALLSEETQEQYRKGGISHILAISGLHVSLLGSALYELLRRSPLGRNGAIPVACLGVILYGSFVEAGTSTKRAVIMFLMMLLAAALGRTYDTLSAMSVSVIVILLQSPGSLYTASFQFSFAAAYGASVMALLLREGEKKRSPEEKAMVTAQMEKDKWFRRRRRGMLWLKETAVFGIAIQVVTFPFTIYHFFEYPMYGMLLNPMVVPLMTILLLCGMLAGVCGMVFPWLGYFFGGGVYVILWMYEGFCRLVSKLPFSLWLVGRPAYWQLGLYFVLLALLLLYKKRGYAWFGLLFLPLCLFPVQTAPFTAAFLDVGQGDGIVLRERDGAVLLVDGGSTDVQKVGEKRLIPYLKAMGIREIDCAFVSHADYDHVSGVKEILEAMPVCSVYRESAAGYLGTPVIKSLVLPKLSQPDELYLSLVELAEKKKVEIYYVTAGDSLTVGKKLEFFCLAPEEPLSSLENEVSDTDKNANSMVVLASYGEFDLLLTGDVDKAGEEKVLRTANALAPEEKGTNGLASVEVLKVAHHGSYTSTSEEFLSAIQPLVSVISCGKNNRYGHPHQETLSALQAAGGSVLRTDESGCVTVKVWENGKIKVEEWK